jgi:flagella basal body P-ring formation protein FlgA
MPKSFSISALLIVSLLLIGAVGSSAMGLGIDETITRIELRSTVRLANDDEDITIGDIAAIFGPQADDIKALTVDLDTPAGGGRWTTISVESIRELVHESTSLNEGSIVISGSNIAITRRNMPEGTPVTTASSTKELARPVGPILRDHLERWVYARLKSDATKTRIQFNDRDRALLSTPTAGRIVEISANGRSEKMSVRIVIYENEMVLKNASIRFNVQIERQVRIVTAQLRRKDQIDLAHTRIEPRWISPVSPIADPQGSLGQLCKATVNPGSILMNSMLESPIVIERGEIISAKSLAGTVAVSLKVRALSAGKVGDLIKLESRDRKQKFTARIAGPGQVVIVQQPTESARP